MSTDGTDQDARDDRPQFEGEPITAERLAADLSFDSDAAPDDDALTDDDARTPDFSPTESED